jgi:hypothetical protein
MSQEGEKPMRCKSFTLALLAMAVITGGVALAQNAHFVKLSGDIGTGGALDLTWKEAGLGDSVTVNYTATAQACAIFACINNGGQHPQAANKQSTFGNPVQDTTCTSQQNGTVSCGVSVGPPSPPITCPDSQGPYLTWVEYKNIVVTDNNNAVSTGGKTALTGPLSDCLISGQILADNPDLCQRPVTCP